MDRKLSLLKAKAPTSTSITVTMIIGWRVWECTLHKTAGWEKGICQLFDLDLERCCECSYDNTNCRPTDGKLQDTKPFGNGSKSFSALAWECAKVYYQHIAKFSGKYLLTFQMNMYHAAIAALLFRSTFWDLIHKIPANAIWPTPCRHQPLPSVHTLIKLVKGWPGT